MSKFNGCCNIWGELYLTSEKGSTPTKNLLQYLSNMLHTPCETNYDIELSLQGPKKNIKAKITTWASLFADYFELSTTWYIKLTVSSSICNYVLLEGYPCPTFHQDIKSCLPSSVHARKCTGAHWQSTTRSVQIQHSNLLAIFLAAHSPVEDTSCSDWLNITDFVTINSKNNVSLKFILQYLGIWSSMFKSCQVPTFN